MSDEQEPNLSEHALEEPELDPADLEGLSLPELSEEDERELRSLIRGALTEDAGPDADNVLAGVQRKLRQRSGGKFYADGWSTSQAPPVSTYLVTSALMLVVVLVVYAVLGPLSGDPVNVQMEPAPVHIQLLPAPAGS